MRRACGVILVTILWAQAAAQSPPPFPPKSGPDPRVVGPPAPPRVHSGGYATRLDYPGIQRSATQPNIGASTFVYLHSLPTRLSTSRERYRARLHLTLDPIFPARLLQDLPSDRLRTELELLWTPRSDGALGPHEPIDLSPTTADPWTMLALGRARPAAERFIDLAIASPDDPTPKLGYALTHIARGDLGGAQFALRRAIELSDGVPALADVPREALAELMGAISGALRAHLESAPRDAPAHLSLAVILSIDGDAESALDHARRAHGLRPRDPVAALLVERLSAPALETHEVEPPEPGGA